MHRILALVIVLASPVTLAQLPKIKGVDVDGALDAGKDLGTAATLSDEEVKAMAKQMRDYEEGEVEKVAPKSSASAQRLAKLTKGYEKYDGLVLNYKVYESDEVNANASADGSVRVYTGLMEMMTDDELLFVIGHEIGHVKLGHTAKAMRSALAMRGARKGAAASGTAAGQLAASEMGGVLEAFLNAQYSQSQETQSDDYGVAFLKKTGADMGGAASSLGKLAELSGGKHSMLSSHPDPKKRADRVAKLAAQ
jgi:putative metalloprotease